MAPAYQENRWDRQIPGGGSTGAADGEPGTGKREPGAGTRLLCDVHGRITHVCLALPTYQSETVPRLLVDERHVVLGRSVGTGPPARTAARTLRRLFAPPGGRAAPALLRVPARSRQPSSHQDLYLTLAAQPGGRQSRPRARGPDDGGRGLRGRAPALRHDAAARGAQGQRDHVQQRNGRGAAGGGRADRAARDSRAVRYGRRGGHGGVGRRRRCGVAQLGFDVCFAEGPFTWLGIFEGSVHCLTKVLTRAEPATAARRSGAASGPPTTRHPADSSGGR